MQLSMTPSLRDQITTALLPYVIWSPSADIPWSVEGVFSLLTKCVDICGVTTAVAVDVLTSGHFFSDRGVLQNISEVQDDEKLLKIADKLFEVCLSTATSLAAMAFDMTSATGAVLQSLGRLLQEVLHVSPINATTQFQRPGQEGGRDRVVGNFLSILQEAALEVLCITIEEHLLPEVRELYVCVRTCMYICR